MGLLTIQRLTSAEALASLEPYDENNRNSTSYIFLDIDDGYKLKGIFFDDTKPNDKKIEALCSGGGGDLTADFKNGDVLKVDFAGNPKKAVIVFTTPMVDALYSPSLAVISSGGYTTSIEDLTENGFTINLNTSNINLLTSVRWSLMNIGDN